MATETDAGFQRSPWLFLLGVVIFLGSTVLFLFDLLEGNNVIRGLVANGVAAVILLGLAGLETLSNPESHVQTRFEALRAVVFFVGSTCSVPVSRCSLRHSRVIRTLVSGLPTSPSVVSSSP